MERLTPLQVWNAMLDAPSQDVRADLAFRALRDGVFDGETATWQSRMLWKACRLLVSAQVGDLGSHSEVADNMRMRLESLR